MSPPECTKLAATAARERVNGDYGSEHESRGDELPLHFQSEQVHALVNSADHLTSEHAVRGFAAQTKRDKTSRRPRELLAQTKSI